MYCALVWIVFIDGINDGFVITPFCHVPLAVEYCPFLYGLLFVIPRSSSLPLDGPECLQQRVGVKTYVNGLN